MRVKELVELLQNVETEEGNIDVDLWDGDTWRSSMDWYVAGDVEHNAPGRRSLRLFVD